MHVDLDELPVPAGRLRSDVCVIGAGIAGLILAHRLAESGLSVNLLEAGGLEFEERSQEVYGALMAGTRHAGTTDGRFRTFGGSSTRWGAQLLPYTADVFAPPAGIPSQPWPVAQAELTPYYPAVEQIMRVDALPFTAELLPALRHPAVPLAGLVLRYSKWAPFAQRNLGRTVGRLVLSHQRARVYTHANVASLHGDGAGRIASARVVNYRGGVYEFAARVDGAARAQIVERLGPFFVDGTLHTCKLEAAPELRAKNEMLAVMAHFPVQEPEDSGVAAIRNLLRSVQSGNVREAVGKNLMPMVQGSSDVARMLWHARVRKRRAVSRRAAVWLNIDMEQEARAANRIRLSDERDALGLPRAVVDWRVGDAERRTARAFARALRESLSAAGFAPVGWTPGALEGDAPEMADTYHAMGGLRMGASAADSVVDADLRVHGLANLYVASCATFPSGGSSNPTFTLMALALRLAERLAESGAAPSVAAAAASR